MLLSKKEDPLLKLRHWHSSETCRESWSCTQLRSNHMTKPGHETEDNDYIVFAFSTHLHLQNLSLFIFILKNIR